MDVSAKLRFSRERAWYSCVECEKGLQGFVIFELLDINLLEALQGLIFDGLSERSMIRALLYTTTESKRWF